MKFDILLSKKQLFLITGRDVSVWFPINVRLVSLSTGDRGDAYILWLTWLGQPLLDWRGVSLGDSPSRSPLCLNARFGSPHSGNRQGYKNRKADFSASRNSVFWRPLSYLSSPHAITLGQSYTSSGMLGADAAVRWEPWGWAVRFLFMLLFSNFVDVLQKDLGCPRHHPGKRSFLHFQF